VIDNKTAELLIAEMTTLRELVDRYRVEERFADSNVSDCLFEQIDCVISILEEGS